MVDVFKEVKVKNVGSIDAINLSYGGLLDHLGYLLAINIHQ